MIYVVGVGPGLVDYITNRAYDIIKNSDVLIGGKRNLDAFYYLDKETIEITNNLAEIVEYIRKSQNKQICIVASGDPLIYGIGKYISEKLSKENVLIIPGISSIQYLFSKVAIDMNDIYISSCHGRVLDFDYILSHPKVALLTDDNIGPYQIASEIIKRNLKKVMIIGENLSYENEKINILTPEQVLGMQNFDMNVVVVCDER